MLYVQDEADKRIHLTNHMKVGYRTFCGRKMSDDWKARDETENGSLASCVTCRTIAEDKG